MRKIILGFVFVISFVLYVPNLYKLGPWEEVMEKDFSNTSLFFFDALVKEKHTGKIKLMDIKTARKKRETNEVAFQVPLSDDLTRISESEIGKYSAIRKNEKETEVELLAPDLRSYKYTYSDNEIKVISRKLFNVFYLFGGLVLSFLTAWIANLGLNKIYQKK